MSGIEREMQELLEKYRKLEERVELQLIRLKEENRKLKEALKSKPASYIAEMRSAMDSERRRLEEELSRERAAREEAERRLAEALKENERLRKAMEGAANILSSALKAPEPEKPSSDKGEIISNLPQYEKSIYEFLANHRGVPFTAYQISVATKKSPKSSAFRSALAKLVKLGLVEREGSAYRAP